MGCEQLDFFKKSKTDWPDAFTLFYINEKAESIAVPQHIEEMSDIAVANTQTTT